MKESTFGIVGIEIVNDLLQLEKSWNPVGATFNRKAIDAKLAQERKADCPICISLEWMVIQVKLYHEAKA